MPCSNELYKRVLLGFLGFAHKLNDFGLFCGDSVILWLNFGSNLVSIFCGKSKLDNMWDMMGNICERTQDNLWGLYMEYLWEIFM